MSDAADAPGKRMFAADESGDPGLDVPGGASRYFSLVLIEYDAEEIRQLLRALRKQQKLPEHFEYHFAQGTSRRDDVRHRFMEEVAALPPLASALLWTSEPYRKQCKNLAGRAY